MRREPFGAYAALLDGEAAGRRIHDEEDYAARVGATRVAVLVRVAGMEIGREP